MEEWEFEEIAEEVVKRALAKKLTIKGPTVTCLGWGWAPTLSFWCGIRRIHIYLDFNNLLKPNEPICYTIELADRSLPEQCLVKETNDFELYWQTINRFLIDSTAFSDFSLEGWHQSKSPQDAWIPDPPDAKHSGDFGEWGDSFFAKLRQNLANQK